VLEGEPGGREVSERQAVSILRVDKVSKTYRSSSLGGGITPALRKVSFDINPGEVISLIGESGSGKTTIGKIVLRLVAPTSGTVTFGGKDIATYSQRGLREYYRHVQGVFQDPFSSYNPIYRADRVFELVRDVYFSGIAQRDWDAKIEAALDAVALNPGDVLGKYPHQLSGGQQQRLLIARALLLEVKVLVADEIISMLDASTRVDVLNLLVKLKRDGLAILFVTHDLSLGNYVSDRTIILRHGAIVEMGATEKVFGNPRHDYTKMLLSAVPELHKKWQRPEPAAVSGNGAAAATSGNGAAAATTTDAVTDSRNGGAAPALAHVSMLDELSHAQAVVKRDFRSFFGGRGENRPSPVAVALEPPALTEFEPDHLVAEPE
jgi:peptide/nickel transport system ATP-binding protein